MYIYIYIYINIYIYIYVYIYLHIYICTYLVTGTLAQRLECSPMARETWVQYINPRSSHTKDFKNGT